MLELAPVLFPLAYKLSGGRLVPEILIATVINVGSTLGCVIGLRWALADVDGVPPALLAWPWEKEAWCPPEKQDETRAAPAGSKED